MPRNYVKKGYTAKQKRVAGFIVNRPEAMAAIMRNDPILLHYAADAQAEADSHWYVWIKLRHPYKEEDLGGGKVRLHGRKPGGKTRIYHSRYGIIIINVDRDENDKRFPKNVTS